MFIDSSRLRPRVGEKANVFGLDLSNPSSTGVPNPAPILVNIGEVDICEIAVIG